MPWSPPGFPTTTASSAATAAAGGWWSYIKPFIIPAIALGTLQTAVLTRLLRSSMIDVLSQDYMRTARAKGVSDLLVRFGKCCHPIPGDPILGYVTRGKGITVHLRACPTVLNERDLDRLIEVEWEGGQQQTYPIAIRIEAYDRTGLLSDITNVVAENKVNILAANVSTNADHTATVVATLQVASVAQLAKVLTRLEGLKDVYTVQRDFG